MEKLLLTICSISFDLLLCIFVLRFMVELMRTDFKNPICQFLARFSHVVVYKLSLVIPNFRNINFACLFIALLLSTLRYTTLSYLSNQNIEFNTVILFSLCSVLVLIIKLLLYCSCIVVILSYLPVNFHYNYLSILAKDLINPCLKIIRRFINKRLGNTDYALVLLVIILLLINNLLLSYLDLYDIN